MQFSDVILRIAINPILHLDCIMEVQSENTIFLFQVAQKSVQPTIVHAITISSSKSIRYTVDYWISLPLKASGKLMPLRAIQSISLSHRDQLNQAIE